MNRDQIFPRPSSGLPAAALPALLLAALLAPGPAEGAVPGEVQNLRIAADRQTLSWDPEASALHYHLYRGYVRDLTASFSGTVLDGEIAATTATDPAVPVAGQSFFYLVTAANGDGEGPNGWRGDGAPRGNAYPWPGYGVAGRWEGLRSWPDIAIHMATLRTGKILTFQGGSPTRSRVYDPATGSITTYSLNQNLFCAGHSFLPDGKLLVTGGNTILFSGPNSSWTFDPGASSLPWSLGPNTRYGRYYPTNTTLGDGRVITFTGNKEDGERNLDVEIYTTQGQDRWVLQTNGSQHMALYPMMHLLPDGRIFRAGPETQAKTYTPSTQAWQNIATSSWGFRNEGTSVMLPGSGHWKIMVAGGINGSVAESTNTAEVIDLSAATPAWSYAPSMHFKRVYPNAVLLPDGTILMVGGGYDDFTATYPSELYDPQAQTWTVVATMRSFRLYHSTAVLMSDGRVMAGGSNDNATVEFFSPGYLFRGARPTISSAPTQVRYGNSFSVGTPDAPDITSVVFMRPGAVTHAFDQDQRHVPLSFTAGATSLSVTAPSSANAAPPGYYMLFILKTGGIPSEAKFVKLF